jgi:hypothetical protein
MVEMVRAYAVDKNAHKPVPTVESISDWVVHKLSNLYHAKQVEKIDFSDLAMRIDDTVKGLYFYSMNSFNKSKCEV